MKKSFLTSIAILVATFAADASAALPNSISNNLLDETITQKNSQEQQVPFILGRTSDSGVIIAAHHSHASHASHASHVSSRY